MSYYSDVTIKCGSQAYAEFMKRLSGKGLSAEKILVDVEKTEFILLWKMIQWNTWNTENELLVNTVKSVMDFLDEKDTEKDPGYGYLFIRFGETHDDMEERTNDPEMEMCWTRTPDTEGFSDISGKKETPPVDPDVKAKILELVQNVSYAYEADTEGSGEGSFWPEWSRLQKYVSEL